MDEKHHSTFARMPSGIPRLDHLLYGEGLYIGALYIVQGYPGLGKTILAHQFSFHQAAQGHCGIYVTLLSEATARMIEFIRPFAFADITKVGSMITYLSGYHALDVGGLAGLLAFLKAAISKRKGAFLVVDGLDAVYSRANSENEYRQFVHELQTFAAFARCTTLLLTTTLDTSSRIGHAQAAADGIFELTEHLVGPRAVREIQLLKFRGSNFLKGRHEVEINVTDGFVVHPRTEIQFHTPFDDALPATGQRLAFGIKNFDAMLHGGLVPGSVTALFGAPGTGKTSLGLSFLIEGAKQGEDGVLFSFYETPARLLNRSAGIGLDLKGAVASNRIEIQWQQMVENIADSLAERLLERIRARGASSVRVFIDGLSGLRRALPYPERFGPFLSALANELRRLGATTLVSEEAEVFISSTAMPSPEVASNLDNVIFLRYVEMRAQLHRLISIMKMRDSAYESTIREFTISANGIAVASSFASAEKLLASHEQLLKDDDQDQH